VDKLATLENWTQGGFKEAPGEQPGRKGTSTGKYIAINLTGAHGNFVKNDQKK